MRRVWLLVLGLSLAAVSPAAAEPPAPDDLDAALAAFAAGDLPAARAALERAAAAGPDDERQAAALLLVRLRALEERRRAQPPSEDGARTPYLVTTSALGLGLWGWTLPLALHIDAGQSTRTFVGVYMTTAATSFVLPYFLTRARPPSWGEANLAFYGGTRGALLGGTLSALAFGSRFDDSDHALAAAAFLGSVAGLVGGQAWARADEMSPGRARTVAVVGDAGALTGFALGHLFGLDDASHGDDGRVRGMAAAGLGGAIAGLGGGRLLAARRQNTWGDGEVTRAAGALGVFTGATVAFLFDYQDRSKPVVATLGAGGWLGLAGGDFLVRDTDYTFGQAVLIDLSMVAGGLGAAGLTYLAHQFDSPRPYMVAGTVGGGLGLGLASFALRGGRGPTGQARSGPQLALLPQLGTDGARGLMIAGGF